MALSIKLSTFVSGGFTGDLMRWILKEDVSGATVDTHEEPGPHNQIYNFVFDNNIQDIIYRVELYDVPPGGGVGTLIKAHVLSVTTSTLRLDTPIEIIVDGGTAVDPADNDTATPAIPDLIGRDYSVEQRSTGTLLAVRNPEFTPDTVNGGFALTGGQKFRNGDVYIVHITPIYVVNPPGSSGTAGYKDVIVVTTDMVLTSLDVLKKFIINTTQKVLTITFPAVGTIPPKMPFYFENNSPIQNINVVFACVDKFYFCGKTLDRFIISRGDACEIIRVDGELWPCTDSYDLKRRGKIEFSQTVEMNRQVCDGSEFNQADYPGIVDALNQDFNAGQIMTSLAGWNLVLNENGRDYHVNRGYFLLYTVSGTPRIRFPDLRNQSFRALKFINGVGGADVERLGQRAGGHQYDTVGIHAHGLPGVMRQGNGLGTNANGAVSLGNPSEPPLPPTDTYFGSIAHETRSENIGIIPTAII